MKVYHAIHEQLLMVLLQVEGACRHDLDPI